MADYNFLLETRLSQDQQRSLQILQEVCRAAAINLYLTGGPMRDLLCGRPVRLLEVVTEGDPVPLAAALRAAGAERLSLQADAHSLRMFLRGVRVRVVQARGGTIVEDLKRRGLTLNSIGLSLNPGSRGLPLDPNNGAADIEARLIRMNHSYVFFEEPIVILRALRLQARLEFALEERTQARLAAAREGNYLQRATAAARGQELEAIAYEPDPAAVLRLLDRDGWLEPAFGKGVRAAKMNLAGLARLTPSIESWEQLGLTVDAGLVAMPLLLSGLPSADQSRLAQSLPSRHLAEWKKVPAEARTFEKRFLAAAAGPGQGWLLRAQDVIEHTLPEAVVWAALEPAEAKAGKKLKDFQAAALQLRQRLPFSVLRGLGLAPHSLEAERLILPWYRRLLAGEPLSDAELVEGLRRAVEATRAPSASAPPPAAAKIRGKAAKPSAPSAPPQTAAKAAPVAAPPRAAAPAKAKPAPKPRPASKAKPAPKSKPAAKARPAAKAKPGVKSRPAPRVAQARR